MSARLTALTPSDAAELENAGFSAKEITAVDESITISRALAVQSLVEGANGKTLAAGGAVRRESHGKHQGCLRARFEVSTSANIGLFQHGASYPAWIRLSNGGAYQRDDRSEHISRGYAIKVLGVAATPTGTHDFLMITSPRFFIRDLTHYPSFLKSSGGGRLSQIANFLLHLSPDERSVIQHRRALTIRNLLESPGYSAVPYQYGNEVVKYAIAPIGAPPPVEPQPQEPPEGASEDYLEEAMNATLAQSQHAPVCFGFYVQRQGPEDAIDDPTNAWTSPFEEVARLTIPFGQHRGGPFDYQRNDAVAERLAFNPFNAASGSRPLGKINLMRKFVYDDLAAFRRRDLPVLFSRWKANPHDTSVAEAIRDQLKKIDHPEHVSLNIQDVDEPQVDEAFKALGIVE